jgi:hypothetical protein
MIVCPNCGEMNPDDAMTCSECMVLLNKEKLPKEEKSDFAEQFARSVAKIGSEGFASKKIADVMFVFDCTASMGGEIRAMQDAIIEFARTVTADGLNVRLGLVEFRDRSIGEKLELHRFSDGVFTKKLGEFQKAVDKLKAKGGGAIPESSPDALMLALEQDFRDCPNKTIVLITDAPPRIPDVDTPSYNPVIARMEKKDINQFYVVTMLKDPNCHIHLELLEGVQKYGGDGLAFELSKKDTERKEHFIKVLRGLAKSISSKSVTM